MLRNNDPAADTRTNVPLLRRRPMRTGLVTAISLVLATGAGLLTIASNAQADITTGLVLNYKLDETSGTVAHDSSGHNHDGTVLGTADLGGDNGLGFNGTDTSVKLPNNIMQGLDSISVDFNVWVDSSQTTPYMFYGLGNTSGSNGNGYLFTTGTAFRTSVSLTDYTAKKDILPADTSYGLPRGQWEHVTYTQTGTTGVLYENGVEKARNTNVTITPGAIGGGTTTANFLGKSLYANDKYFKGRMRDFRIYDHALSSGEVVDRANDANLQAEELQAMKEYNGALDAFEDPNIGPVLIFPADYTRDVDNAERPPDWKDSAGNTPTLWPSPTGAKSQFTFDQIGALEDAAYAAINPADTTPDDPSDDVDPYAAKAEYVGMSDRIVVTTNAPASVTDPLVSAHPNQIVINRTDALPATAPVCTAEAGVTTGLVLDYKLDETDGTAAHDSSGNGHDGTVLGTADLGGDNGLGFNGTDTSVKLPNNIMQGLNSITVDFDVKIDSTQGTPYMFYGLGNTSGSMGNGYLFTTGTAFRTSLSMTDYTAKQDVKPADTTYGLPRGQWEHVTYTQTGTTGILYENGVEKARNTNVTITPGAIG
ncbi:Concanavalin A-like lectin/glucanases superfamily protein, partial [Streptomyces sp. yr375]